MFWMVKTQKYFFDSCLLTKNLESSRISFPLFLLVPFWILVRNVNLVMEFQILNSLHKLAGIFYLNPNINYLLPIFLMPHLYIHKLQKYFFIMPRLFWKVETNFWPPNLKLHNLTHSILVVLISSNSILIEFQLS